ncbi:hypothetical protein M885DRAFT_516246 [Pelagophyceae sp. CCMP2097]|nr:hypothetical protein M885DRAFT_516246 [Pelagophyceae sp. CCMP2097]
MHPDGAAAVAASDDFLEEQTDVAPTPEEVAEYARLLGATDADADLLWIASEGLVAPLPQDWRACQRPDDDATYYFNVLTGLSSWAHPSDAGCRELMRRHLAEKAALVSPQRAAFVSPARVRKRSAIQTPEKSDRPNASNRHARVSTLSPHPGAPQGGPSPRPIEATFNM